MKILIVSYYFAPQNLIGAVRPTKIAKYLARMGHEVTVLCGAGRDGKIDPTLERDLAGLADVHLLREINPLRWWYMRKKPVQPGGGVGIAPAAAKLGGLKKRILRTVDAVYRWLRWMSDVHFSHLGRKELKKLSGPYDAVFSTYAPFSVHQIARKARKSGLAQCWIADFRDEVGMPFAFQKGKMERYMRMIRREADIISAVSDGFLEMMGFEDVGRVLSNGFDREDLPQMEADADERQLRVVYCGQLQDSRREVGNRDITPMFRALAKLVEQGALRKEEICLAYAGREGALFAQYAEASGLRECVEDHGQVSREASIALQKGAGILLMGSHHMASQKGILTGKLFEYMMMDKPIVCCMAGDLPNSGVKQVLAETGMGLCCEAANAQADEAALLDWLKEKVRCWRENRSMLEGKNSQCVEKYGYPFLAGELAGWMKERNGERNEG